MKPGEVIHPAATLTRFMPQNWEAEDAIGSFIIAAVDERFDSASPQHPARRWEYSLGLLAAILWRASGHRKAAEGYVGLTALDVGGAGSPFAKILTEAAGWEVDVIDPGLNRSIEEYDGSEVDAVFSISVLEHVPDPEKFLKACVRQIAPGGLLFLTVDAWEAPVGALGDTAHMNWMRQRIYTPILLDALLKDLRGMGMKTFGEIDLTWRGPTVYDYGFASIAMVKEG